MIIALDGNVFAGKTTLCNILSKKNDSNIVLEYSDLVDRTNKPSRQFSFSEHSKYLKTDVVRKKYFKKGVNFIDRSFVSLSAHIYAIYKIGIADFRERHLRLFSKLLDNDSIIIPDYYIFVTCNYNCAKNRFLLEKNRGEKRTPELFISKDYFLAIDEFNNFWQSNIKSGLIIDNSLPLNKKMSVTFKDFSEKLLSNEEIFFIIKSIYFDF